MGRSSRVVRWRALLLMAAVCLVGGSRARSAEAQGLAAPAVPPPASPRKPQPERPYAPRDSTYPLARRLSADPEARTLELIYVLREYQVFSRDDEMAEAIRELHRIGPAAVPELIAELDRTNEDVMLRVLGIALRVMDDPRAVPALIRAIPKTLRPPGSDCGLQIEDPELAEFLLLREEKPDWRDRSISLGRPVNEIHAAIGRLTKFQAPGRKGDALSRIFLETPEEEPQQRQQFRERQQQVQAWWDKHGREFLSEAELRRLDQPSASEPLREGELDRVDRAGEARFGPLFPTGPGVELSEAREVELFTREYADAPTGLDADRGRLFRTYEGTNKGRRSPWSWLPDVGVDLAIDDACHDTRLWIIDDRRWETIDEEVQRPGPLVRRDAAARQGFYRQEEPVTALFTTREGGRGILQVSALRPETVSKTVKYRMWPSSDPSEPKRIDDPVTTAPVQAAAAGWAAPVYVSLEAPGPEARCAWSVSRGERRPLPPGLGVAEMRTEMWNARKEKTVPTWRTDEGGAIDFVTEVLQRAADEEGGKRRVWKELALVLFDATYRPVRPACFSGLSAAEVRRLLAEDAEGRPRGTYWLDKNGLQQPQTYVFQQRDGEGNDRIGLLQIQESNVETGLVRFRYKLSTRASPGPGSP